ncbi:hypothetical protein PVAG01_07993 [Phlyctema vagabunda]|uniref:Carrier domain-containing protein n=1 Tax=Phlyctema vagabunda TaxID=108571 RepID=A0ABR4PE38_9HELO
MSIIVNSSPEGNYLSNSPDFGEFTKHPTIQTREVSDSDSASDVEEAEEFEEKPLAVSPAQQDILLSIGVDRSAWVHYTFTMPTSFDANHERLRMTWQAIASCNPALRTCLTVTDTGVYHKILRKPLPMIFSSEMPSTKLAPSITYSICKNGNPTLKLWTHPALVDEFSIEKLFEDFVVFYNGYSMPFRLPFQVYIRDVHARKQDEAASFWRQAFASFHTSKPLFSGPSGMTEKRAVTTIVNAPHDLASRVAAFELAHEGESESMLLAAWGVVLYRHLAIEDVAFKTTVRDSRLQGSGNIIGFLEATVPLRLKIRPQQKIQDLLRETKDFHALAKRAGYIGLKEIEALSPKIRGLQTKLKLTSGFRPAPFESCSDAQVSLDIDLAAAKVFVSHPSGIGAAAIEHVVGHFLEAVNGLLLQPEGLVQEISLVSPVEASELLAVGKAQKVATPRLVQQLFEDQCKMNPSASAVHFLGQEPVSYSQLNSIANRFAQQLLGIIQPGTIFAVHMETSVQLIAALLAILKAGGAYVIVDPQHPDERKKFVFSDSGARACIVATGESAQLNGMELDLEIISMDIAVDSVQEESNLDISMGVESPAYIIYTSGSTGRPKGVILSHRAVSSGIVCGADLPSFRSLLFYNPVFSAAQRTILSTLAHGGCLCLAGGPDLRLHLADTIRSLEVNNLGITASTISLLDPEAVQSLQRVTFTGESIRPELIEAWASRVELRNNYGLSECTQLNWGAVLSKNNPTSRSIGIANDTTSAYILDMESLSLAPFMVPGELCLSGSQLADGYIGLQDATAKAFVPNPFVVGERLYRTGDLATRLENGSVEILGRVDAQVKINGQRIEPGEIEVILRTHNGVKAVAIVPAVHDGHKSLVACIVQTEDSDWVWSSLILELRAVVLAKLPTYMVPSYWISVPSINVNSNGKTDIKSLVTAVEQKTLLELVGNSVPPSDNNRKDLTDFESVLQAAVSRSLNLPTDLVDIDSSFLSLGGDSLRAINTVSSLLQQSYTIDLADILLAESLGKAALAMTKSEGKPDERPQPFSMIPKHADVELSIYEDVYPTTPLQESVISAQLSTGGYVYDRAFGVAGKDLVKLKSAFEQVIQSGSIYRTTFLQTGATYWQGVMKNFSLPWDVFENTTLDQVRSTFSKDTFEFSQPFIRAVQIDKDVLIIRIHHALFDYWSARFLFDDVAAAYLNESYPTRVPFASFVNEITTLNIDEASNFWTDHLQDVPVSRLESTIKSPFNSVRLNIDTDLRALGTTAGLTIGVLAYAAWALILWKHTGNPDVVFAITLSGRTAKINGIHQLDGPTLVTVPFRVRIEPSVSLLTFARSIQTKLWEVVKYSQFGMRKALEVSGQRISPFDTMVNYLVKNPLNTRTQEVIPVYGDEPIWPTGLTTLQLEESEHGTLEVQVSGELEPLRTKFLAEQVAQVLETLAKNGETRTANVEFSSISEKNFLESLSTKATQPEASFLHRSFEIIAAQSPDRTAIQFGTEEEVTYSQLNSRANLVARELSAYGVGPDTLVPICLPKSIEAIVAILAILKAGSAFVPLDPDNPPERNNFIVEDVRAAVVITDENYASIFAVQGDRVPVLNIFNLEQSTAQDDDLQIPGLTADHLASIAAGIDSIVAAEGVESTWKNLQFSNYVFDVAIGDIFCTFSVGAVLCMVPFERMLGELAEVINEMQVTRLFLTPTVARLIQPEQVPQVEGIYLAGEPVTADLVATWASHCIVMNCYGPTEVSILSVAGKLEVGYSPRIIGEPLKNCTALILDPANQDIVPYGAVGELCLGGHQLARGYLNRPDATESAFVTRNGERLYRTGDLAKWVAPDKIECLGRKDSQVKINGHRIEIGEVENAILSTRSVHDVAVVVVKVKEKSQIVAFCNVEPGQEQDTQVLSDIYRESLALLSISLVTLAPYMKPQIWIPVHALPRMPSGKINRRALAQKAQDMGDAILKYSLGNESVEMHHPVTPDQELLQSLWGEIFTTDAKTISITSAFFSHGGDSISAINLVGRLRGRGYLLAVSDVLAHPVLQDMASRLRSITQAQTGYEIPEQQASDTLREQLTQAGIEDGDIQAIWPTPPGVEEFLIRGAEAEQFWQCQTVRSVPADFDFEQWKQLTAELTRRNDILRTIWVEDEGEWKQIILRGQPMDVAVIEVDTEEAVADAIKQSWDALFNIASGTPFVRYRLLVNRSANTRSLLIKIHHAMYDGTLLRIFDDQFRALARKQQPPRSLEFSQYVGYMNATTAHRDESLGFWKELLADRAAPYPYCRQANATAVVLETVDSRVDAFAAQCGVTPPIVFQTAFTMILAKLSGSPDVSYDNLITGRNVDLEDAQTINGNCANFLPFRLVVSPEITVRELLTSTQKLFWKTTEYGDVNKTRIQQACGESRETGASHALFLFQPFEPVVGSVKHMRWMVMAGSAIQMTVDYALHLEVSKTASGYKLKFQYDPEIYALSAAKDIAQATVKMLQQMIAKPYLQAQAVIASSD